MWLLWLFVALPIVEIALFIQVGGLIGVWATLALVVLAFVLGLAVIRSQGSQAWTQAQRSLAELRDPSRPLAHGMMLILAGVLLMVPGFLSDAIGLLLLIAPLRNLLIRQAGRRMRVRTVHVARREPYRPPYADGVIDADYIVEEDPGPRRPPVDLPEDIDNPGPPRRGRSGWTRH